MSARERKALPRHPFRDSAIFYGVLAIVIVAVTLITGGGLAKGILIAVAFFVASTAWTWWRFRRRLEEQGER
jgi:membrane protein implicated in regulation of membrane protease activity